MALTDSLIPYAPRTFPRLGNTQRYLTGELLNISKAVTSLCYVLKELEGAVYTTATLPAASTHIGARYTVSDATSLTFGATLTGGGSIVAPVWSNGTSWLIG